MENHSSARSMSPRKSPCKSPRKRIEKAWSPPHTPTLYRNHQQAPRVTRAWDRHPRPAAAAQGHQGKVIWKRQDAMENQRRSVEPDDLRQRQSKHEKVVKKVRVLHGADGAETAALPSQWDKTEDTPHRKTPSTIISTDAPPLDTVDDQSQTPLSPELAPESQYLFAKSTPHLASSEFLEHQETDSDAEYRTHAPSSAIPTVGEQYFASGTFCDDETMHISRLPSLTESAEFWETSRFDDQAPGTPTAKIVARDNSPLDDTCADQDEGSPGSEESESSQDIDGDDTCVVDPFALQDTLVINDRVSSAQNHYTDDSTLEEEFGSCDSPVNEEAMDNKASADSSPTAEENVWMGHSNASSSPGYNVVERAPKQDHSALSTIYEASSPTRDELSESEAGVSRDMGDSCSVQFTAKAESSLFEGIKALTENPSIEDESQQDDASQMTIGTVERTENNGIFDTTRGADTTIKVHLNDEDADVLRNFLNRSRASRADRQAKIAKRTSYDNRRDSGTVKSALASPTTPIRKVLDDLDTNSASPHAYLEPSNEIMARMASEEGSESIKAAEEMGNEKESKIDEEGRPGVRRSARAISTRAAASQGPSSITIRRSADPSQEEDEMRQKKEARELYNLTKANTRQNKGKSVSVRAMLVRLNEEARDRANLQDYDERTDNARGVRWNDNELVHYFESGEQEGNSQDSVEVATTKRTELKPTLSLVQSQVADDGAETNDGDENMTNMPLKQDKSPARPTRIPTPSKRRRSGFMPGNSVSTDEKQADSLAPVSKALRKR